jgi:hypothetical protein
MIVISRKHQEHRNDSRRHHHNTLRSDRVRVDETVVVSSHALLLPSRISIEGAEIHIARSLIDPRVASRRLKTFMNDNGREREKQSVQT